MASTVQNGIACLRKGNRLRRPWTPCLRLFSFPSQANEKTEKNNTFSAVEDSTLLRWHSGTQKRVGRAKERDQLDNEARLSWKSIVKTKHQSLTSLAFIWLVPGADRVVRHICIRCILSSYSNTAVLNFFFRSYWSLLSKNKCIFLTEYALVRWILLCSLTIWKDEWIDKRAHHRMWSIDFPPWI